jgi:Skp family chaperone for outer membrane proteins
MSDINYSAWLPFIGSLIVLYFTWREARSRIKINEVDADGKYQEQIDKLVKRNGELFEKMEDMRTHHEEEIEQLKKKLEAEREEYKKTVIRLNDSIRKLDDDLRLERERNLYLMKNQGTQISKMEKNVDKIITGRMPIPPEKQAST